MPCVKRSQKTAAVDRASAGHGGWIRDRSSYKGVFLGAQFVQAVAVAAGDGLSGQDVQRLSAMLEAELAKD